MNIVVVKFKVEDSQVLKVEVDCADVCVKPERLLGRMNRDGRNTVPRLTAELIAERLRIDSLAGVVLLVKLEPSGISVC